MAAGAAAGSGSLRPEPVRAATAELADSTSPGLQISALKGAAPRIAQRSPLGDAMFSMPHQAKTPSLAARQSASATVPHNIPNAIKCRGLITQSPPALTLEARIAGTQW